MVPVPVSAFQNPLTSSQYRLHITADSQAWRVTKTTTTADGQTVIRHLRGTSALPGISPEAAAIDALVRGVHQTITLTADPQLAFAETVLLDLDRTANVLTALAHEARVRRVHGAPGFRPGCSALREQERQAMVAAVHGCQTLGAAWIASGLGTTPGLPIIPDWLQGAIEDAEQPTSQVASPAKPG